MPVRLYSNVKLVARDGLEPSYRLSESRVLPLDDGAISLVRGIRTHNRILRRDALIQFSFYQVIRSEGFEPTLILVRSQGVYPVDRRASG